MTVNAVSVPQPVLPHQVLLQVRQQVLPHQVLLQEVFLRPQVVLCRQPLHLAIVLPQQQVLFQQGVLVFLCRLTDYALHPVHAHPA